MAELISEDQPRIKFELRRVGAYELGAADATPDARRLAALMGRLEQLGAAPVLCDGLVGGNCAIRRAAADASAPPGDGTLLVSRSGKRAGAPLADADFVRVTAFDRARWAAEFESAGPELRPSSDTPLLQACLLGDACRREYGWRLAPRVALHGHAMAEGEGLEDARRLGVPVSERETLFSTPDDLAELEALFRRCPYPEHRLYVRRGHGFFLLAQDAGELARLLEELVAPAAEAEAARRRRGRPLQ